MMEDTIYFSERCKYNFIYIATSRLFSFLFMSYCIQQDSTCLYMDMQFCFISQYSCNRDLHLPFIIVLCCFLIEINVHTHVTTHYSCCKHVKVKLVSSILIGSIKYCRTSYFIKIYFETSVTQSWLFLCEIPKNSPVAIV